jgi:hypothetical protein
MGWCILASPRFVNQATENPHFTPIIEFGAYDLMNDDILRPHFVSLEPRIDEQEDDDSCNSSNQSPLLSKGMKLC